MLRLPPIRFLQPQRLEEAASAAADEGVRLVAGGTDLWPNLKRRHQRAETVVSLLRIPELNRLEDSGGELRIGATV